MALMQTLTGAAPVTLREADDAARLGRIGAAPLRRVIGRIVGERSGSGESPGTKRIPG
jgi:hypothetical protein